MEMEKITTMKPLKTQNNEEEDTDSSIDLGVIDEEV